jgi:transmembrane sensor
MGHALPSDTEILNAATDWFVRQEGDAPDYDGFATWLEADARHREAYDRVIALDTLVADQMGDLAPLVPANDDAIALDGVRLRWAGFTAVLAIVLGTGAFTLRNYGSGQIIVATEQGQLRTLQLADASMVTLDGNSAISYAKDGDRSVTLTRGSAHFEVKHDEAKPFSVAAGTYKISDLGTAFSVSRTKDHLSISVASGLVTINGPTLSRLPLNPGERIDIANGTAKKTRIDPASVGAWRQGRLIYVGAPLWLVVADINRYAGKPVLIDPKLSGRRFSGVLTIGNGTQLAPMLASVMGIAIRNDANGLHLGAGGTL